MSSSQLMDAGPKPVTKVGDIVVGLDDSPAAAAALRWAAAQSRLTGSRLHVVHAWQMGAFGAAALAARAVNFTEAAVADARARATRWAVEALHDDADIHWQLDIVEGSPGPVLVGRSDGARLLVLGTQEHTGFHRAVPGSVSHYCLSHAHTPIVAVPAPSEAPELARKSR
jgi:nucleotide-binding universal stress UspA family protein